MTSVPLQTDRRQHRRYAVQSPVRYRAANSPLNTPWRTGSVRNMSASGILVQVAEPLAAGARLELALDWCGLYHGREKMRLFLTAIVTRIDGANIALRILSNRFRDASPARVRLRRSEKKLAVA